MSTMAPRPASTTPAAAASPAATPETVLVLDFGSQYSQLICRRVREAGAFSLLVAPTITVEELRARRPKAIILSGGPASVFEKGAPRCDPRILELGVPVLGICYGMQLGCQLLGSRVAGSPAREFGRAKLEVRQAGDLLKGIPADTIVWASHGDQVTELPEGFEVLASTSTCPFAAVRHTGRRFWGVQFHPEVTHTPHGVDMLRNFLYEVCGCRGTWRMSDFLDAECARVRSQVGKGRVLCGLSGGVDSSVVAALLARAIGSQLTCIFVDNGVLRKNERQLVENTFRDHFDIDLRVVDASAAFLKDLEGVTDPQEKRRRIGHRFIDVFRTAAAQVGPDVGFLAQGTLYPDRIESGQSHAGTAANIKLHHNVGGLPADLGFQLVEPLKDLFKDEVRALGDVLGLPQQMVWRHPFPGPGLAVRVVGEVTRERLDLLRDCDQILLDEIHAANLYRSTSQVFAVLLPIRTVGVMGDGRTYDQVLALRAVTSTDGMTAESYPFDHAFLAHVATRIINEVRGVSRVVYDVTSKPPGTIEWE